MSEVNVILHCTAFHFHQFDLQQCSTEMLSLSKHRSKLHLRGVVVIKFLLHNPQ